MRIIGTLNNEQQALKFSQFLKKKGIAHHLEILKETNWDSPTYGLNRCEFWIKEEDHFREVLDWFNLYVREPENTIFQPSISHHLTEAKVPLSPSHQNTIPPPLSSPKKGWDKQPLGWMTSTLIGLCCALFFASQFASSSSPQNSSALILFNSPIDKALLFDYPKFYQLIDRFLHRYGYEELEQPTIDLPADGLLLLKQINQTPVWPGLYQLILKEGIQSLKGGFAKYPMFEKIRDGQIWRLFSPALLHGDLFHLFFNMLWLIVLGKQIEQRLSPPRFIIFILMIGIISNIAQYLMSGSNFIGFSGVLCGMLAFIWMRQRTAAWEGYQMERSTLIFMLIFIISMAMIQTFSFVLEKSYAWSFSPNIANVAHITGGLVGFLLGKLNFFSWRHP